MKKIKIRLEKNRLFFVIPSISCPPKNLILFLNSAFRILHSAFLIIPLCS